MRKPLQESHAQCSRQKYLHDPHNIPTTTIPRPPRSTPNPPSALIAKRSTCASLHPFRTINRPSARRTFPYADVLRKEHATCVRGKKVTERCVLYASHCGHLLSGSFIRMSDHMRNTVALFVAPPL